MACNNAGEMLDIILEAISLKPYRMMAQFRHADEIMEGYSRFPVAEKADNDRRLINVIAQGLEPYQQSGQTRGLALSEMAEFIYSSACSAKYSVRDEAHLRTLLKTLKVLVLKGL